MTYRVPTGESLCSTESTLASRGFQSYALLNRRTLWRWPSEVRETRRNPSNSIKTKHDRISVAGSLLGKTSQPASATYIACRERDWPPCWPLYSQQVLHQRWISGIHGTQVTKHASKGSTLALKPRVDIIRSLKKGYQWPHKKDSCPPKILKKKPSLDVGTFWESDGRVVGTQN